MESRSIRHTAPPAAIRRIVVMRCLAAMVALVLIVVLWKGMAALPWQADAVLAVMAALVWAYAFERKRL